LRLLQFIDNRHVKVAKVVGPGTDYC
jgi:hypothetical protein